MTINIAVGSGEITGFAEIKDVNITLSFEAEETGAVVKQFLPAIREFKEFGIFQTQKNNDMLSNKLTETIDEKRDAEREKARLQAEVRELKEKLREAQMPQPQAQVAKKS